MTRLTSFSVAKFSGAGNTFSVVDATENSQWIKAEQGSKISRIEFVRKICDKVLGICTDGVLFIQSGSEGYDFDWDFYNSDGSTAEMCGNAARCAARFCYDSFAEKKLFKFKTGAGAVSTQILNDGTIQVRMPEAVIVTDPIELSFNNGTREVFTLVNSGVPHLVKRIKNLSDSQRLKVMAQEARSHQALLPHGANVTFFVEDSANSISAVTYERGVEDYTLACGTGAVAAALIYAKKTSTKQISVRMPGGILQVQFIDGDNHPLMIGEAIRIGDFKYNLEVIK